MTQQTIAPGKAPAVVPGSTYRLQFHSGFTFRDALALVPYLADLGVTHVYASPFLKARKGSTHGYDIVDHGALNPEIGTEEDFIALTDALKQHGMGMIADFVSNHMGIGQADNPWWLDVLEYGEGSPYAEFFDIDFHPMKPELRGKVLLPFLGNHYGRRAGGRPPCSETGRRSGQFLGLVLGAPLPHHALPLRRHLHRCHALFAQGRTARGHPRAHGGDRRRLP